MTVGVRRKYESLFGVEKTEEQNKHITKSAGSISFCGEVWPFATSNCLLLLEFVHFLLFVTFVLYKSVTKVLL